MATYTREELKELGFRSMGEDVHISKKASIYGAELISIGNHVRIDDFCVLSGKIEICDYIHIAVYSALFGGREGIKIGNYANISSRVAIYALSDDYSGQTMTNPMIPDQYKKVDHGRVVIGKHVILGTGCTVLPHVIIGDGSAVGAHSLVKHSCDPWRIFAGTPCRPIGQRSQQLLMLCREFEEAQNAQG